MSQIRSKKRKNNLKKRSSKGTQVIKLLTFCFLFLGRLIYKTFNYLFFAIKKIINNNRKITAITCTALIASIVIYYFTNKIQFFSETLLPKTVQIEVYDSNLKQKISNQVEKILANAHKKNWKRNQLLNEVNLVLSSYDEIDQYWTRLGFDRKLQITAIPNVPIMLVTTRNSERYLVSNHYSIIAKNPKDPFPTLIPKLFLPQVQIQWTSKASATTHTKTHSTLTHSNTIALGYGKETINLPWILASSQEIYSSFSRGLLAISVTKLTWTNNLGFEAQIKINNNMKTKNEIYVHFGKDSFSNKVTRFEKILTDLEKRGLSPSEVDLDFLDKANFKLNPHLANL